MHEGCKRKKGRGVCVCRGGEVTFFILRTNVSYAAFFSQHIIAVIRYPLIIIQNLKADEALIVYTTVTVDKSFG